MDDVDADPRFLAWCERMALGRRLKLGLPISARGMATLRRFGVPISTAKYAPSAMTPELVHETVDQAIDLDAMYDALATLLVRYYRTRLSPALA